MDDAQKSQLIVLFIGAFIGVAISIAFFMISQNPVSFIFIPITIIMVVSQTRGNKKRKYEDD